MKKWPRSLTLMTCLTLMSAPALAEKWTVDTAKSSLKFSFTMNGGTTEGHFKSFASIIDFSPEKPETSAISIDIDIASATMGDPQMTPTLAEKDWFFTSQFPKAKFVSTAITASGDGNFEIAANLSIKGQTHPMKLPFKFTQQGTTGHATGELTLSRKIFALGLGQFPDASSVSLEIKVLVNITADVTD